MKLLSDNMALISFRWTLVICQDLSTETHRWLEPEKCSRMSEDVEYKTIPPSQFGFFFLNNLSDYVITDNKMNIK